MSDLVKIEVRGKETVVRALGRLSEKLRAGGLREVAEAAVASIYKRTIAGRDENDRPFQPTRRQGSTILNDTGAMLASMRVLGVSANRAVIGFRDALSNNKALWHHYGTGLSGPGHAKYPILPKNGKALAFESSGAAGSFPNSVRVGSRNSKSGQQFYKPGQAPKTRRKMTGMTVVGGVMHPGVVPRPFFGISPSDETALQKVAVDYVERAVRAAEAGA